MSHTVRSGESGAQNADKLFSCSVGLDVGDASHKPQRFLSWSVTLLGEP
jgi:hypothetical protein